MYLNCQEKDIYRIEIQLYIISYVLNSPPILDHTHFTIYVAN